MGNKPFFMNKLEEALISLKVNKTFKCSFGIFLEKGIFPDKMKIVKLTPILKSGDKSDLS